MKLLLDTHTILWSWWDDPLLGSQAREDIANASNQKLVSIATPIVSREKVFDSYGVRRIWQERLS